MSVTLLWYPGCSTCRKAKTWLESQGVDFSCRDLVQQRPSADELAQWQQRSGLLLKRFFNTSGQLYRQLGLKDKLPTLAEREQLELLSSDGMLVKRPILLTEAGAIPGFKEESWRLSLEKEAAR